MLADVMQSQHASVQAATQIVSYRFRHRLLLYIGDGCRLS